MNVAWLGLVDDRAAAAEVGGLVGSVVVADTDLPSARDVTGPVTVEVSGGAGGVAGPVALASRLGLALAAVDVTLRDLDDLPGNARRVVAAVQSARDDGLLEPDVPLRVGLPPSALTASWLTAVDVVAEADLRVGLRLDAGLPGAAVLDQLDALLDRERPFSVTAGVDRALTGTTAGEVRFGFVNLLTATTLMWDGVSPPPEALEGADAADVLGTLSGDVLGRLAGGRRWFTSFTTSDAARVHADLVGLDLLG